MAQTTLRECLQMTEEAINSGRVNEALTNCHYVLAQFPELLEAQRLLGEVYLKQGRLEEAQQTFDWVLTNDPENVVTYCSRALICEQLKDYDTALDCYQQAYELSRGISHIRQEFNQLSEKVGQQGFMFSRAGLARLYMRGDLLPQAIQEWESVLVSAPDRLDARTGLLETYWREGLYDRVEQLARQILNTVPHCLKALVLLAQVTFAQNALQAQELIQQAQALDPDLIIARELFSDFMVSYPKDPFLALLKQPPAVLVEEKQAEPEPVAAQIAQTAVTTNGAHGAASTFSDPLGRWSSLDNVIEPQQEYQTPPEASPSGGWGSNTPTDLGSWGSAGQSTDTLGSPASQSEAAFPQPAGRAESDSAVLAEQASSEQERPWYHMDMTEGPVVENWDSVLPPMEAASVTSSWEVEDQSTDIPAPPAWLDILTKGERRQPGENPLAKAKPAPAPEAKALPSSTTTDEKKAAKPVLKQTPWNAAQDHVAAAAAPQSADDNEEGFFFGPEWLKSLGAAALDSPALSAQEKPAAGASSPHAEPHQTELSAPAAPRAPDVLPKPVMPPVIEEQAKLVEPVESLVPEKSTVLPSLPQPVISPSSWLDQAAQKLSAQEQNLLATLEDLEKDLHSRGFTPLEQRVFSTQVQPQAEEPSLSSALAQLGNFKPQSPAPAEQIEQPQTKAAAVEPLWPSTPDPMIQKPAQLAVTSPQEPTPSAVNQLDALPQLFAAPVQANGDASSGSSQIFQASTPPTSTPPQMPTAMPAAGSIMPIDMELETTMKRPAVRLQSMQQRPDSPPASNAARSSAATIRPAEGSLSNKELLLKGYQYQLAGSYDDAMQEYRIIIRNAPDLLGEVISNLRALLKLAPKYSAGYRMLGDAYMRQGEYLQAMEAYNKALTMAKKAKG